MSEIGDALPARAAAGRESRRRRLASTAFIWQIVKQNAFTRNVSAWRKSLRALRGESRLLFTMPILIGFARYWKTGAGGRFLVNRDRWRSTTSHSDFQRAAEAAQTCRRGDLSGPRGPITNEAGRNVGGENALTDAGGAHRRPGIRAIVGGGARPNLRPDHSRFCGHSICCVLSTQCPADEGAFSLA